MILSRRAIVATLLVPLARCAPPSTIRPIPVLGNEPVYVIEAGWHTEIGLETSHETGLLKSLTIEFPTANTLTFGWGQRDFYMDPNPSLAMMLRAAFPGPSVMLVRPLARPPAAAFGAPARVVTLRTSSEGTAPLCDFIWRSFGKDAAGGTIRAGPGPCDGCEFYESGGTYDLRDTCNTWTAQALRAAGFPVDTGVIRASEVMDQIA
jgi:uncharacterized protein (TIGR02117 family)